MIEESEHVIGIIEGHNARLCSRLLWSVPLVLLLMAATKLAAQDKFALESPNGIAFSEFEGYDAWPSLATSQPDDASGCGSSPAPGCVKAILGNRMMIGAYQDGVPGNGQSVPDGAVLVKVEWEKHRATSAYAATLPGAFREVSFMLKDSKRVPGTNGWGYATLKYDGKSGTFSPFGDSPEFAKACHAPYAGESARLCLYGLRETLRQYAWGVATDATCSARRGRLAYKRRNRPGSGVRCKFPWPIAAATAA
jgi:hypothetical protein